MKLSTIALAAAAFALINLTACKKDGTSTEPSPTPPTPVVTDSNFLSKMYYLDSVNNVQDTFARYSILYDNAKRVQIVIDSVTANSGMLFSNKTVFYYSGTDTLPFKAINEQYEGTYRDTLTTYYTYNSTGRKIRDSIIAGYRNVGYSYQKNLYRTSIQYSGNKIYFASKDSTLYDSYGGSSVFSSWDTATADASNRITTSKKTYPGNVIINTFTYDAHENPFYHLNIFNAIFTAPEFQDDFTSYSKNNILTDQENRTSPAVLQKTTSYTYQYNPSGYPKQAVALDLFSSTTNYIKIIYKYKAL